MYKPLLNQSNPSSVIITMFLNWIEFTNIQAEARQRAQFMAPNDCFRKKVLKDTRNPAIANSSGWKTFLEYYDHSVEFIQFLRAGLLTNEMSDGRNRRRTWKSVADYNGLIARDFLRCQNRVFPARWMKNCRSVTMLNGFERVVEWIVKPNSRVCPPVCH